MAENEAVKIVAASTATSSSAFNSKLPTPIALVAAALLFLLPFLEVRCNSVAIKSVTGVELATGFKIQTSGTGNGVLDKLNSINKTVATESNDRMEGKLPAQLALGFAILGIIISLLNSKAAVPGSMIAALLGTASMIWLYFDIRNQTHAEIASEGEGLSVSVDPTSAFYLSMICFLAAAFFAYRRSNSSA